MADAESLTNQRFQIIERVRHPALLFLFPILLVFGWSLTWGFMLDDYRHLEVMESFESGKRDQLHLFRFLVSDESNAAARINGEYPWWLADDVRYQHWRPLAEWTLYGQFKIFGRHAIGYRFITLAFYFLGVCLTYRLLVRLFANERAARWAALVFTVLTCHAIPVVFISAQADIVALVLSVGALLAIEKYASHGRKSGLVIGVALYAVSLGFKEACLPIAALPALIGWTLHRDRERRRWTIATVALGAIGIVWLYFYSRGGFGSNTLVMLDPIHRTGEYLLALPGRALLLLTALAIPINPFVFYFRPRGEPLSYAYAAAGAIVLFLIGRAIWRRTKNRRALFVATAWIVLFLPLLVCTVPDDRILMLPSIGFAYLIGTWIAGDESSDTHHLRRWPVMIFVFVHALCAFGVAGIMHLVDTHSRENFQSMVEQVDDPAPGTFFFVLDSSLDPQVLFAQSCFEDATGRDDVQVRFLSDSESLELSRTGPNTLELTDTGDGMFTSFLGAMAASRTNPKRAGDEFPAGEVTGRIKRVDHGRVRVVELTFRKNIDDPSYVFFRSGVFGEPLMLKDVTADR